MDAQPRTRTVKRDGSKGVGQTRGHKQLVIPMSREEYDEVWRDAAEIRARLTVLAAESPELFPLAFLEGFTLDGLLRESRKQPGIRLRKIILKNNAIYELRPSFMLPYMVGTVDELQYPLLLLSYGVPCWLLTESFGHNDMYWYRLLERLGYNSVVGTTVKDPRRLPQHLAADEKHGQWGGEKGYIATTTGGGCVLGLALTKAADDPHLQAAYGEFAAEARDVSPEYTPKTVSVDGWPSTRNAFLEWFQNIAIVLCFLHGFIKIRDRGRKNFELLKNVWHVYRAETAADFRQRMADLKTWCSQRPLSATVCEMLRKLYNKTAEYVVAYDHPGCHRTSNLVDRLMNRLQRLLYAGRGLHGHQATSQRRLRGWALLLNFRPFAPRSNQPREFQSPAHRLNQKIYHKHWLHNLNICTSTLGYRTTPAIRYSQKSSIFAEPHWDFVGPVNAKIEL